MVKSALKQANNGEESNNKVKVYFGDVHIREFPLILGDNPMPVGAPLTLDWTPVDETVLDLDFYEFTRDRRRPKRKLKIPASERELYLLRLGYGINKILEVSEQGREIREQRAASLQSKKWDKFNLVFESARAGMKNAVTFHAKQPEYAPKSMAAKSA